jgi:hypothetical protein
VPERCSQTEELLEIRHIVTSGLKTIGESKMSYLHGVYTQVIEQGNDCRMRETLCAVPLISFASSGERVCLVMNHW